MYEPTLNLTRLLLWRADQAVLADEWRTPMFERFTDRARRVVVLSQEAARDLNHSYIGTEHLLLGLLHEGEGVAYQALTSLAVEREKVRAEVLRLIGAGAKPMEGHIPFTPRAKKVLELSLREALQLGHNYIGTEHILLGLIREGEGVAAQVLTGSGLGLNAVRQEVIKFLGSARPKPPVAAPLTADEHRLRALDALRAGNVPLATAHANLGLLAFLLADPAPSEPEAEPT